MVLNVWFVQVHGCFQMISVFKRVLIKLLLHLQLQNVFIVQIIVKDVQMRILARLVQVHLCFQKENALIVALIEPPLHLQIQNVSIALIIVRVAQIPQFAMFA